MWVRRNFHFMMIIIIIIILFINFIWFIFFISFTLISRIISSSSIRFRWLHPMEKRAKISNIRNITQGCNNNSRHKKNIFFFCRKCVFSCSTNWNTFRFPFNHQWSLAMLLLLLLAIKIAYNITILVFIFSFSYDDDDDEYGWCVNDVSVYVYYKCDEYLIAITTEFSFPFFFNLFFHLTIWT